MKIRTIGIVGSEASKFDAITEANAKAIIQDVIRPYRKVVSGACHLGGVDVWAIEGAKRAYKEYEEFPPAILKWEGGYKQRNIQIAAASDHVLCITVARLPEGYTGMRFNLCYHCGTNDHVKSGGCWTVHRAIKMGKTGEIIVL